MTREQMDEHYTPLESRFAVYLRDGDEVIAEQHHFNSEHGFPAPSEWFRTYVGHHMTVCGPAADLHPEPNLFFPDIPKWSMPWIYASNTVVTTLWVHHTLKARLKKEVEHDRSTEEVP